MAPEDKDRKEDGGFRLLLVLGAAASLSIGILGALWTPVLEDVLGVGVPADAAGLARLFGGVMLAVGLGYVLAAMRPHRNRSLLVPLFAVPLMLAVMAIAGVAREEIQLGRGLVFVSYNLAYCLLYFRLYPRVQTEPATREHDLPEAQEGPEA